MVAWLDGPVAPRDFHVNAQRSASGARPPARFSQVKLHRRVLETHGHGALERRGPPEFPGWRPRMNESSIAGVMNALLRPAGPCSSCGFACDAGFAFCPRCGNSRAEAAPAPPPEPEADRRQVTVLFADLTGFTSLAEGLDPETVRAFQNALVRGDGAGHRALRRLRREVRRRCGDGGVRRAARARGRSRCARCRPRRTCCRSIDRLSRQWAARLGPGGDAAHRRAHRAGGRRQPGAAAPAAPTRSPATR